MKTTVFTIFVNGKKYLTIRTTADRIEAKALRMHYRNKGISSITVINEDNQIIFTI